MSDELNPCPFCGREAIVHQCPEDDRIIRILWNVWIVGCDGEPGCPGYVWKASPIYSTKENAIEHWNRRADIVKKPAKVIKKFFLVTGGQGGVLPYCENCNTLLAINATEDIHFCPNCGSRLEWG